MTTPMPWAVVVNPTKVGDLDAVRQRVAESARTLGWPEPTWHSTSADDPGVHAVEDACAAGARLVVAMGGDGTVRHVASALRGRRVDGQKVVMGIAPAGTGNLLARNLELPLDDLEAAVRVALTGDDHEIDVAVLHTGDDEICFVVAGGVGIDADMMANTDDEVKRRLGWLAYLGGGAKSLLRPGFRAGVRLDGDVHFRGRSRCVLVCNCATVTAGVEVALDGRVDDGVLDVVALSPRGPIGWVSVARDLLTRRRHRHGWVRQWPGREVSVELDRPTRCEVDGDVIGTVSSFRVVVEPGVLTVRVPPPEEPHYPTDEAVAEQVADH